MTIQANTVVPGMMYSLHFTEHLSLAPVGYVLRSSVTVTPTCDKTMLCPSTVDSSGALTALGILAFSKGV